MGNEMVPEFVIDQGVYHPAAANYYGYYSTGLESPSDWSDHNRLLGTDGQNVHSPGLQTEGLQYVYYTPSYGYAQSAYNPYNPFMTSATMVAPDTPFTGTQQYVPTPMYHQPVSSSTYIPVVVQPGLDVIPTVSPDPSLVNSGTMVASRPEAAVVTYMFPPTSLDSSTLVPRDASQTAVFHSMPKLAEAPQALVSSIKPVPSQGTIAAGQLISQGGNGMGSLQTFDSLFQGNGSSGNSPSKLSAPSYHDLDGVGSNIRGWARVDELRSRYAITGGFNTVNCNTDTLGEQNRGPRTSKPMAQSSSSIVVKAYTSKAGFANEQGNIIVNTDQYNRRDFPVNYPSAKFFIIKSYSEDDVHKSIKYNVWSSTPNGNKRLDVAFEDAQRVSRGNKSCCPVFLFFSVNASGQFCGLAEMTGPVDFHKDMDFWQQDKWSGSFPVKWHIVKDVPNTSFRHIILENNDNKPVTNSRDTQEVLYIPGLNMLSIFKDSPLRTSILDDFFYYEERQRFMHEEKSRLLGGSSHGISVPVVVSAPPRKVSVTIKAPPKQEEKPAGSSVGISINDTKAPLKKDENPNDFNDTDHTKAPPMQRGQANVSNDDNPLSSDDDLATSKTKNAGTVEGEKDANAMVLNEIESLSLCNSSDGSGNHSAASATSGSQLQVFTVGSVPVKVGGYGGSSEILSVGANTSADPKVVKRDVPTSTAAAE